MTPAEAAVLLGMAAAVDNRKPDAETAKAWAAMLDGLRFEDCQAAIVEHFKTSTDYLMPVMVCTIARRIRAKRIAEHPPVEPPPHDCPTKDCTCVEFLRSWRLELNRRIGDGQTFDQNHFYAGQLVERGAELRALMAATTKEPECPPADATTTAPSAPAASAGANTSPTTDAAPTTPAPPASETPATTSPC